MIGLYFNHYAHWAKKSNRRYRREIRDWKGRWAVFNLFIERKRGWHLHTLPPVAAHIVSMCHLHTEKARRLLTLSDEELQLISFEHLDLVQVDTWLVDEIPIAARYCFEGLPQGTSIVDLFGRIDKHYTELETADTAEPGGFLDLCRDIKIPAAIFEQLHGGGLSNELQRRLAVLFYLVTTATRIEYYVLASISAFRQAYAYREADIWLQKPEDVIAESLASLAAFARWAHESACKHHEGYTVETLEMLARQLCGEPIRDL